MADVRQTMLDAVKANAADDVVGLISEITTSAPEFGLFPARTISGTSYKTRYRTANPTAAFRGANGGLEATKSTYELRTVETYILDMLIEADKAVANAYEGGPMQYQYEEAMAGMEAAIIKFGSQVYYGNPSETDKGFPGLLYQYDSSTMDVDAGGTSASTGSSVWAVRLGPQGVQGVFGNNSTMTLDPWAEHMATADDGGRFKAYYTTLNSWVGLQTTSKTAIGRIRDLTEDSGKGLTDDLLYKLLEKFPAGMGPNAFLMNRRSLRQLRESRTATTTNGAPAPLPTELEGIPIIVTDSITSTETLDVV